MLLTTDGKLLCILQFIEVIVVVTVHAPRYARLFVIIFVTAHRRTHFCQCWAVWISHFCSMYVCFYFLPQEQKEEQPRVLSLGLEQHFTMLID